MTLGKRIGQYRRKLGLTQEALARKLDVTNQAVSKWESDQCCPDISLLPGLADIFGITIDELFGRSAPVQLMTIPQPEPEPEPIPEPDFILVGEPVSEQEPPHQDEGRYSWKDSFWGNLFHKTIRDFEHRMKDFDEKLKKDRENWTEPDRERRLPDDIELPWEDDGTLRVALFVGKRLITGHPARNRIEFCYEGPAVNIYSECSVTCDAVGGNVWAGDDVSCNGVGGSVTAGGDVSCDYVNGYVEASGDVDCETVNGNVDAGGDVSCGDVHRDVKSGGDVDCGDVLGNLNAGGDVSCGDVQGNVSTGGDVDCGRVEGFVSAGGDVTIG